MKILLILITLFLLTNCDKEYSCENCLPNEVDTTGCTDCIPNNDTTYNELISRYDFELVNGEIRKIYFCVKTKYHPGHYYITDSIPVQASDVSHYNGSFNLAHYLDMGQYVKNDTFPVFYEIRFKNANILQTDSATLIY